MSRILHIIARALSLVLYPLFIPTYGMALFCYAYTNQVAPLRPVWMGVAIGGTAILTCLLPLSAILIMVHKGDVTDIQIENPNERTLPYLSSAIGFGFWAYLVSSILHAPLFLCVSAIGGTIAILIVAIINRKWKISAHLTGFGGLLGGMLSYCIAISAIPTWGTLVLWLGVALILMYARLYLNAHTAAQVSAGWLLGLTCTLVPNIIIEYAIR